MVFDVDDVSGISPDYECYKKAIAAKKYTKDCKFGKHGFNTDQHLMQTHLEKKIKTYNDTNDKDRIIVIDNTEFPKDGAKPVEDIILEYANHSIYQMKYNLRDISIYMGLASMLLCFATGALTYLGCKIRRDIKRKFLSDDEDEDE